MQSLGNRVQSLDSVEYLRLVAPYSYRTRKRGVSAKLFASFCLDGGCVTPLDFKHHPSMDAVDRGSPVTCSDLDPSACEREAFPLHVPEMGIPGTNGMNIYSSTWICDDS